MARLATLRPDGRLDLVPITFVLVDNELYTAVDAKPKRTTRLQRLANIAAHPEVTVLFDHYEEEWSALWWVRLRGRARVVEAGSEWEAAITALSAKYDQYRDRPPEGPAIVIEPRQWRGWSGSQTGVRQGDIWP